jgi:23S rRNA maturation mini-RNase III
MTVRAAILAHLERKPKPDYYRRAINAVAAKAQATMERELIKLAKRNGYKPKRKQADKRKEGK